MAFLVFGCLLSAFIYLVDSRPAKESLAAAGRQVEPTPKETEASKVPRARLPSAAAPAANIANRFLAFQPPGPSSGQRLIKGGSFLLQANSERRKIIGRTAPIDKQTFPRLAEVKAGDAAVIPLFDGEQAEGVVNLAQTEPSGWVRLGGELTDGRSGTFYLASNGSEVRGFVQLPAERLVYEIVSERGGATQMVERFRGDIVCDPLPPMRNETPAVAALRAGPLSAVRILNSRPEAAEVIYLDFDGETVTDPAWNGGKTIVAASFNLSDASIVQTFDRVKDDWISFNVNITTDPARYAAAPVGHRMRCIITPTDTAAQGAGGVAYLYSFSEGGSDFSATIPCWVFNSSVIGISEAISHELGHTMGLDHDGRTSPGEEYFEGHGSGAIGWCPIMGAGYYKNVVQWSKGEYQNASNREDDLEMITAAFNHFGYASDLAGNTRTSPASLTSAVGTGVVNQAGVIERNNDIDFFRFSTNGGSVSITAQPATPSPDLDISLELQNANGDVLAANNPTGALNASLSATVPAGQYFLKITNSSAGNNGVTTGYSTYGSLGGYTLGGTIGGLTNNPIITSPTTAIGQVGTLFTYRITATGNPATFGVTGELPDGLAVSPTSGVISGVPTEAGTFNVVIFAQNSSGTGTAPLQISIAPPLLTIAQAMDFEALTWTTGSDVPWRAQTVETFDNEDAAQAGGIADSQSSYVETTVTGPCKVTFRWKVSSEADNDVLAFQIDEVDLPGIGISGDVDWTEVTEIEIPGGSHKLRWVYRKNDTLADGADTAWVDVVEFISPAQPVVTSQASVGGTVGNLFSFQITATNIPGRFAVTEGVLPPGLELNAATGRISGVPAVAGTFNATVSATNNVGSGSLAMTFAIAPSPIAIAEALDNADVTWTLGGDTPAWFPETAVTFFGGDAAQAGPIGNGQTTFITTTITGPRTVNFYWKAECEPGSDKLSFLVDNVEVVSIDGFADWENRSIFVAGGTHTLKWVYKKDASGALGRDTAYLDKVVITTDILPVVTSADEKTGQVGIEFSYAVTATNVPKSFSASGLPSGLSINSGTGVISGVPGESGDFTATVGATNDAGTSLKTVVFRISPAPATIGDATDAPQLFWTTGGDAVWFATSDVTFDGQDAVRSGTIANSQSSFIQTQVSGPISVRFRWKIESELNKDYLRFFINGQFQSRISGNVDWQEMSYTLSSGPQMLRWEYQKDASVSAGADIARLDTVNFSTTTTTPVITSPLVAAAFLSREFRYQATATNIPTTFTATGLPNGLTIFSAGLISGTPQAEGTFNIQLQALNGNGGGTVATLVITVVAEPSGADDFTSASSLSGVFVRSEGTNLFASADSGEPPHAGRAATASVWWSWRAPISGEVRIDTIGSAIDTVLSVYRGDQLGSLTVVAENDDLNRSTVTSGVKFKAIAGKDYLIAVDGLNGAMGSIILNITYGATGNYQGLAQDVNDVEAPALATFTLSSKFAFTGSIIFQGKKCSVKGTFVGEDFTGFLTRAKGLAPLPIILKLNLDPGAEEITGSFVNGTTTYTFLARHSMLKADVPPILPGAYTFVIEPDENGPGLPGGFGHGTVVLDKNGKAKVVGVSGDGTKFSLTAPLATDSSWVLFAQPYKAGGVVAGEIATEPNSTIFPPLNGGVFWRKTADQKAKLYRDGFITTARFKGYPYAKPSTGVTVLTLSLSAANLDVLFSGGDLLSEPVDFTGVLNTGNKFTGGPTGFKLTFNASTGLFSGSYVDASRGKHAISGAVLQGTQNRGTGFFIGTAQTGMVELKPVVP